MSQPAGKIVTFYSFKGGVGRTMALANIAFLAAMNGKRVLVMDWDLEAPGLAYYFRGLVDPAQAKIIKDAKGVLNLFSDWIHTVQNGSPVEVQDAAEQYSNGRRFADCAVSLVPPAYLEMSRGALDYISAGSRMIQPGNLSYEQMLASFSWQNFFEQFAGGAILEKLRDWCKKNYDLILIDSRTGLADVAGICTMQLPDEVILCFTLNRQNIDGVSRIALAVRHNRNERIKLRAIPMRTSRVNTPEESDARARALSDLTRIGGFSLDALQEDFKQAIWSTEGVPFYETLAPLLPQTPEMAVFSLNYLQLASQIVEQELDLPELPIEWMEAVRRRMQPRHATIEYITELQSAEPFRLVEELERLLEGALEEAFEGGQLDDAYVEALTDAALWAPLEFDSSGDMVGVGDMALELLRALYAFDRGKWSMALVDGIEKLWANVGSNMELEQQLALLDEADGILADSNTLSSKIRRLDLRRSMARTHAQENHEEQALQHVKEARNFASSLKKTHVLASDQSDAVLVIEADLHRLEGEIMISRQDTQAAVTAYQWALRSLERISSENDRVDAFRQRATLHARLSRLLMDVDKLEESVEHALASADWSARSRHTVGTLFSSIAAPVIALASPYKALDFCMLALATDVRSTSNVASYAGRNLRMTADLLETLSELAELVRRAEVPNRDVALEMLSRTARQALGNLTKRRTLLDHRQALRVQNSANRLIEIFSRMPALHGEVEQWRPALQGWAQSRHGTTQG